MNTQRGKTARKDAGSTNEMVIAREAKALKIAKDRDVWKEVPQQGNPAHNA